MRAGASRTVRQGDAGGQGWHWSEEETDGNLKAILPAEAMTTEEKDFGRGAVMGRDLFATEEKWGRGGLVFAGVL